MHDDTDTALVETLRAHLRGVTHSSPPGLVSRLEVNTLRELRARRGSSQVRVVIAAVVFSVLAAGGNLSTVLVAAAVALCYAALVMNPGFAEATSNPPPRPPRD